MQHDLFRQEAIEQRRDACFGVVIRREPYRSITALAVCVFTLIGLFGFLSLWKISPDNTLMDWIVHRLSTFSGF